MNFNNDYMAGYYKPDYFCGILPNADESRHEFKIMSSTNKHPKKENIEDKVKEQEKGMVKGPHIHARPSTEGSMQKQGRNYY